MDPVVSGFDFGGSMQVGDLVKNIYTGEIGLVTEVSRDTLCDDLYVDVDWKHLVPAEHLMVINESR